MKIKEDLHQRVACICAFATASVVAEGKTIKTAWAKEFPARGQAQQGAQSLDVVEYAVPKASPRIVRPPKQRTAAEPAAWNQRWEQACYISSYTPLYIEVYGTIVHLLTAVYTTAVSNLHHVRHDNSQTKS